MSNFRNCEPWRLSHVTGYTIAVEAVGSPLKVDPHDASDEKVDLTIFFQDFYAAIDSAVNCIFLTFAVGTEEYANMIAGVTGWDGYDVEEFLKILHSEEEKIKENEAMYEKG